MEPLQNQTFGTLGTPWNLWNLLFSYFTAKQ
jgi:hypothetical protein